MRLKVNKKLIVLVKLVEITSLGIKTKQKQMSHNGKSWHKPLATERYDTVQVVTERVSPERNKEETRRLYARSLLRAYTVATLGTGARSSVDTLPSEVVD